MDSALPEPDGTEKTVQFAVGAAVHGPSVHNTQPWRFGHGKHGRAGTS